VTRSINIDSQRAYRVIVKYRWGTMCYGPYSTLSAAKGKRTLETGDYREVFEEAYIEQTPEGWERVAV